jgi:transcriptional regulator with XRE-family HTH domain
VIDDTCRFTDMGDIRWAFGLAVHISRERLDWSQTDLSRESGIDRGYISRIETGSADPGLRVQRRLAEALGITLTELVGQAEEELGRVRRRRPPETGEQGS